MTERGYPLRWLESFHHTTDCTDWPFSLTRHGGYGQLRFEGKVRKAHQVSFILSHGREPIGLIRHACDNPRCVNPLHLAEGTPKDNMCDAVERRRLPRNVARPNGKLSVEAVRQIKDSLHAGVPGRSLASSFGVSEQLICNIKNGRAHTGVPERHYDKLTAPWVSVFGKLHADDVIAE